MKIYRVSFYYSDTCKQNVDIEALDIGKAVIEALMFLTKRGYSYKLENCNKVELISEPIQNTKVTDSISKENEC